MIQLHLNGLNQNCLNFKEHLKSSATIMQYRVNMLIYVVNLVRLIVLIYLTRQVAPDQFFLAVFHCFYTAQLAHGITLTFLPKSQPYTDEITEKSNKYRTTIQETTRLTPWMVLKMCALSRSRELAKIKEETSVFKDCRLP